MRATTDLRMKRFIVPSVVNCNLLEKSLLGRLGNLYRVGKIARKKLGICSYGNCLQKSLLVTSKPIGDKRDVKFVLFAAVRRSFR